MTLDCPNNRYINDEQICQNIAAMWSRVGVKTAVKSQPLAPFFAQIQKDDTSVYLLGWGVPTLGRALFLPVAAGLAATASRATASGTTGAIRTRGWMR